MISLLKIMQRKWRRNQAYKKIVDNKHQRNNLMPMIDFLSPPEIDPSTFLDENEYLVVDIETTGLSYKKDEMLSIGFVPIINNKIELSHAKHYYVSTQMEVGESATIHGIHDKDIVENGQDIEWVMQQLLSHLKGRILIVHYAGLDYSFLNKTSKKLYDVPLLVSIIDTLEVERKRQSRQKHHATIALQLDDCRNRYGLPRYGAHNALTDAIATAELWLAQMSYLQKKEALKLNQLF